MAWLGNWAKRVKLTIDQGDIASALTDFPVLIYISTSSGRNSEDVSFVFDELTADANRKKIAVTTTDGTTQCYVEIQKWDDANERAWLWVKVPGIASGADTDIYLYYDSSQSENTTYVSDIPNTNVWNSDYKLVLHGEGSDASTTITDSSASNHTQTCFGNAQLDTAQSKIGGSSILLDGSGDYISIPDSTDWTFGTGNFAMEFWARFNATPSSGQYQVFIGTRDTSNSKWFHIDYRNESYILKWNFSTGDPLVMQLEVSNSLSTNTWYHVMLVRNGTDVRFYVNSSSIGNITDSDAVADSSVILQIGEFGDLSRFVNGWINELRISKGVTRDPVATYQTAIDHLLDWGSEELGLTTGSNAISNSFTIRRTGTSKSISSSVRVKNAGSNTISNSLTVKKTGSYGLSGSVAVKHGAQNSISCSLTVRRAAGPLLSASVTVRKAGSEGLSSSVTVRKASSYGLSGSLTVRKAGSQGLSASVTLKKAGLETLSSSATVRRTASDIISGSFTIRKAGSNGLSTSLAIRKAGSNTLSSSATVRRAGSSGLSSSSTVRQADSKGLSASVRVLNRGSNALSGSVTIKKAWQKNLSCSVTVRKADSSGLSISFHIPIVCCIDAALSEMTYQAALTEMTY